MEEAVKGGWADSSEDAESTAVVKPSPKEEVPWYDTQTPMKEREHLTPWQTLGITYNTLFGVTYGDFCNSFRAGKGKDSLRQVAQSPAGKRFKEKIVELMDDPMQVMKLVLENNQLSSFGVHLQALGLATKAGDYKAMHTMVKDIGMAASLAQVGKDSTGPQQIPTINLNIQGSTQMVSLDLDEPETESVEIVMADVVEEDIDYSG